MRLLVLFLLSIFFSSCHQELQPISVAEFSAFIEDTDYVTEAETYGWSIVQQTVFDFQVLWGVDWRCPTGLRESRPEDPVTQVSYNDALAYVKWKGGRLPSYEEYWQAIKNDTRPVNENTPGISPLDHVNVLGNVWELTVPDPVGRIRLAGGSYLCNTNTCNGTSQERVLHVDPTTGNSHIGFALFK